MYIFWMIVIILICVWCIIAYPVINAIRTNNEKKRKEKEFKKNEEERLAYLQSDEYKQEQERLAQERKHEEELAKRRAAYAEQQRQKAIAAKRAKALAESKWLSGFTTMSVKEFFTLREKKRNTDNFTGVYILHNETKNMYYVGQATKIFDRVNNHFTGRGNGDVYADYKYKNIFTIKLLPLAKSEFTSLDKMEKYYINKFNANTKGYNKTAGNN